MNSSLIAIRFGLYALTGAVIGTTTLHTPSDVARAEPLPIVSMSTITVQPSEEDVIAAFATASRPIPTLPTVYVTASEEEKLAARIDPTDRIQVMSPIRVTASAEDVAAAAMQAAVMAQAESSSIDDSSTFGHVINVAVSEPHRLRLDMPYYSVGRVLTHAHKN
jgi:hypothetical protein